MTCFWVRVFYIAEQLPCCSLLKVSSRHKCLSLRPRLFPPLALPLRGWAAVCPRPWPQPRRVPGWWRGRSTPWSGRVERERWGAPGGASWPRGASPSSASLLRALTLGLGQGMGERRGVDESPRTSQGDPTIPFLGGGDAWGWGAGGAHLWPPSHASMHMSFPSVLTGGEKEDGTQASAGPLRCPLPHPPPSSGGTGRPASQGPLGLRVQRPAGRPASRTPFGLLLLGFPIDLPSEVELVWAGQAARSTRSLTFAFSFSHASILLIEVCVRRVRVLAFCLIATI